MTTHCENCAAERAQHAKEMAEAQERIAFWETTALTPDVKVAANLAMPKIVTARVSALEAEKAALRTAMEKINDIRNSIVGFQKISWSEHIYPLVIILDDAGFAGAGYEAARNTAGTLLQNLAVAEARVALLERLGNAMAVAHAYPDLPGKAVAAVNEWRAAGKVTP